MHLKILGTRSVTRSRFDAESLPTNIRRLRMKFSHIDDPTPEICIPLSWFALWSTQHIARQLQRVLTPGIKQTEAWSWPLAF